MYLHIRWKEVWTSSLMLSSKNRFRNKCLHLERVVYIFDNKLSSLQSVLGTDKPSTCIALKKIIIAMKYMYMYSSLREGLMFVSKYIFLTRHSSISRSCQQHIVYNIYLINQLSHWVCYFTVNDLPSRQFCLLDVGSDPCRI